MNGKNGQGTHSTKMGADKSAENTPNDPKMFDPIWDFRKKLSLGVRRPWLILLHALFLYSWERRDRKIKR